MRISKISEYADDGGLKRRIFEISPNEARSVGVWRIRGRKIHLERGVVGGIYAI